MSANTISHDHFIRSLLAKLPAESRDTFSDAQLIGLKAALGGRTWGVHAIDIRHSLKFWRWHYYFVFLAGRNRRELSRREENLARMATATVLTIFILMSTLLGLLVLYLVKSALGIDLIPGFHLGIWDYFI
ncbi:MAG TPA: hypothetical protein VJZ49_09205 [Syntrophales bacterium]|nr:hypothetical protein [Syntrophales bacterium]